MTLRRCENCQTWIDWDNSSHPTYPVFERDDERYALCDDCAVERGYCPDCGRYIGVDNAGLQHAGYCADCAVIEEEREEF